VPTKTAQLSRPAATGANVRAVDWSGYRGIRRYSPYYYPGYSAYSPYYYGNYAYRPWYARPYAYAWGYPGYAGPVYRSWYPAFVNPAYLPYSWGAYYPPPVAAPMPAAVYPPQVFSIPPGGAADYVGCFYW
jgi:hypothetical protein